MSNSRVSPLSVLSSGVSEWRTSTTGENAVIINESGEVTCVCECVSES